MNSAELSRAAALRAAFDQGFARLPEIKDERTADLLAITMSGAGYALRLGDVVSLTAGKKIARVPAAKRGLLGIAGFRGLILPVYDLAALIGLGSHAHGERPRWLAVVKPGDVAIAFDAFDGHLRVPDGAAAVNEYKDGARRFVSHLIPSEGLRGVIDLESVLKSIAGEGRTEGNDHGQ